MIEQITEFMAPLSGFIRQHAPVQDLPRSDVLLGSMLVIGVLASTLGTKLARPIVTLTFAAAGGVAAGLYGGAFDLPLPVTVILASVLAGLAGVLAFRLWVGIGAGALLALIALSVYGSAYIIPHLQTFPAPGPGAAAEYTIPDVPLEQQNTWDTLGHEAERFWAHLKTQQADVEKYTLLIAAAAGLFGLVLGVLAVRFTLVVLTAGAGTLLVSSAVGLSLQSYWPHVWESLPAHATEANVALLAFFAASLVLQTLLTRRPPQAEPPAAE